MSSANNVKSSTFCDICGKTFQTPHSVRIHRQIHTKKATYKCEYCNEMFAYLKSYKAHVNSEHSKERETNSTNAENGENDRVAVRRLFQCKECERMFETTRSLRIHEGLVHSDCLSIRSRLKPRMIHHGTEKPQYQCRICNAKFATLKSHTDHKQIHGKVFKCKICRETFNKKSDQIEHLTKHKQYKCLFCDKTFTSEQNMRKHMTSCHQSEIVKYFTCTMCNICFDNEDLHGLHMIKTHWKEGSNDIHLTKQINGSEEQATNVCREENNLSREERMVIDSKEDKRFTCDTCGASFSSRYYLKRHINYKHFDGTLIQYRKKEILRTRMVDKMTGSTKTNTPLNKRILEDFKVDNTKLTYLTDPDSHTKIYVCKVCLTTYSRKHGFVYHIHSNASDHDIYLKRKEFGSLIDSSELPNELSDSLNSPSKRHEHNDFKHYQNTRRFDDAVIDARSTGTYLNNGISSSAKANYVSSEIHSNVYNNLDEAAIMNTTDDVEPDDMQPLYTARRLLPEDYMSEGTENYGSKMSENDDFTILTDVHNTCRSEDGYTDIQSNENISCFKTTSTLSTHMNTEKKAEANIYNSVSNGNHFFETTSDVRTDETTTATTKLITLENEISEISDQCNPSVDISSVSKEFPCISTIRCTQCKTSREISNQDLSNLRCCLCHGEFCSNCSGLPGDIYKVLLRCKTEHSSGLIWTCDRCKSLLPKLANIVSNLTSFDQHVNSRLKKLEDRLSLVRENWNRHQL